MTAEPNSFGPASPRQERASNDVRQFWAHYRPFQRSVLFAGAVSASAAATEIALLAVLAMILKGLGNDDSATAAVGIPLHLSVNGLLLVATSIVVARTTLSIWGTWLQARLGSRYETRTRADLVDAYLQATWPAQSVQRDNEIQDVATGAVLQGRVGLKALSSSVGAACSALIMLVGAIALSWFATIAAVLASLAIAAAIQPLVRRSKRTAVTVRDLTLRYVAAFGETINLARQIRLAGVAIPFTRRLTSISAQIEKHRTVEQSLLGASPSLFELGAFGIVFAGLAFLNMANLGNPARFIAMLLLLLRASQYGRALQGTYHQVKASLPYLEIIDSTRNRLLRSTVASGSTEISGFEELALIDVDYTYTTDASLALRAISLRVRRGEVIGIIGPSGSGKSTLVEILLGLRTPTSGTYTVDGIAFDRIASSAWYQLAGLVTQDPQLIEGDLVDNIRFLRPHVSDAAVSAAIRDSGLERDLAQLPNGLKTRIGPRGMGLSGGQRQRLSIARVLAGQPALLVLDEPTSALDVHAENVITETVHRLKGTTTILIVAHRLTTLRFCDRVAVVRDGTIEACGDRSDLLLRSDYYAGALELALDTERDARRDASEHRRGLSDA